MISDEDKQRVREATDIVNLVSETVVLRPRGNDFWGCCPFHQEKSPSFHVTPATGLWHCFGCHSGGDVFDYVMKREGLDFLDSVRYLAERAHIDIEEGPANRARGPKRTRVIDALEAAQQAYATRLMRGKGEGAAAARAYFKSRGFNSDICSRWHLGYADASPSVSVVRQLQQMGFTRAELEAADLGVARGGGLRDRFFDRVMFPIHDEQGRCIAFGGRVMSDAKPKYLNTRETSVFHKSKHMFAFDYAKESIAARGYAIVTEGYMDVISMHEAGFTNTVAALGTALSLEHVRTLSRFAKTIVCMFDGDAAGQHAAEAAVRYVESTKAALSCVVLPGGQDPDEFLKEHGADAMAEQLKGARPLIEFVIEKKLEQLDLSSPGLRLTALDELAKILAPLKDSYLLDGYAQQVASRLGLDLEATKAKIRATPVEEPADQSGSTAAWEPEYEPADYAPYDDGAPATWSPEPEPEPEQARSISLSSLSPEDRTQIRAERNLLALMADHPDNFRVYAERISTFAWADARHEAIAWAILATPANATPAEAVAAATQACPEAPRILSASAFSSKSSWDVEKNVEFVVGEAEIRSLDRRINRLTTSLSSGLDAESTSKAFEELTELRTRRAELRAAQPLE